MDSIICLKIPFQYFHYEADLWIKPQYKWLNHHLIWVCAHYSIFNFLLNCRKPLNFEYILSAIEFHLIKASCVQWIKHWIPIISQMFVYIMCRSNTQKYQKYRLHRKISFFLNFTVFLIISRFLLFSLYFG